MKYIDEFRNKKLIQRLSIEINKIMPRQRVDIMEVCGTHTQNVCRFGCHNLVPFVLIKSTLPRSEDW